MVRRFSGYGLELTDCYGSTNHLCKLLPALEIECKTSVHVGTNKASSILEKGCNPTLPQDSLRNYLVEMNPKAASLKGISDKDRKNAVRCMEDSFSYSKGKWEKSHATPDFKVGDLVRVSTNHFNKIKG
ncbi:hypothetical protein O181_085595 [Austropuccinia psidii MF-1]|uniref:Uncharacterized protein n=1 Tax=Austropuccinia psidii MF-1 TaxID=1389203 RepID=A0A9Q3FSJ0_9BASI|nr:hypothetical protein [Austropuccinia psidii MF-1]